MRKVQAGLFAFAALLCVLAFWLFRVGPAVEVEIPPGSNAHDIAVILTEQRVLSNPWGFRLLAKVSGLDRGLKPGTYKLRQSMSSPEALYRIYRGGLSFIRVTIPEGWRAAQIAARLEDLGVAPADPFLDVVGQRGLEGYLFPTTYFLEAKMPPEKVAELMRKEFDRQVNPLLREFPTLPMPLDRVVTLASIVEREARLSKEKPLIARVYLNRLEKRWPLEADPTVQFALGYWKKNLNLDDLKFSSPYNTYRNRGLPPGPICSPGLESLRAVLSPTASNAMYFVADNTGGHSFHATLEEHLQAKEKAKAERRRKKREARKKAEADEM